VAQAQQVDDRQVLARLRHRPVVGRHDEQHMVDAGGAGEHVAHQLFVTRHVDEAQHLPAGQRQIGEAEVDRDAARLLFLQAVGVDASERLHQRGLAMVDVTCGSDDHGGVGREAAREASIVGATAETCVDGTKDRLAPRPRQFVVTPIGSSRLNPWPRCREIGARICRRVHGFAPTSRTEVEPMKKPTSPTLGRRTVFAGAGAAGALAAAASLLPDARDASHRWRRPMPRPNRRRLSADRSRQAVLRVGAPLTARRVPPCLSIPQPSFRRQHAVDTQVDG
jgi:hypothetical protein